MELQDSTEEMDDYEAEILFASLDEYCEYNGNWNIVHGVFLSNFYSLMQQAPFLLGSFTIRSISSRDFAGGKVLTWSQIFFSLRGLSMDVLGIHRLAMAAKAIAQNQVVRLMS
jgi:hypothetical protein